MDQGEIYLFILNSIKTVSTFDAASSCIVSLRICISILSVRFKETICFTSPESVLKEGLDKRNL